MRGSQARYRSLIRLHRPQQQGSIRRSVLLTRLRAAAGNRVVVLSAPAGYGKSTVLAQWAAEDPRPFRWLTVTDEHNDPDRLRSDIAALFASERPRPRIGSPKDVTQIASRGSWPIGGPCVLVVDDAQVLTAEPARRVIDRLVRSVPAGSQLALASRGATCWGVARWAAQQQIVAISPIDLAFSPAEQRKMIPGAAGGVPAALFALCAGWPAASRCDVGQSRRCQRAILRRSRMPDTDCCWISWNRRCCAMPRLRTS